MEELNNHVGCFDLITINLSDLNQTQKIANYLAKNLVKMDVYRENKGIDGLISDSDDDDDDDDDDLLKFDDSLFRTMDTDCKAHLNGIALMNNTDGEFSVVYNNRKDDEFYQKGKKDILVANEFYIDGPDEDKKPKEMAPPSRRKAKTTKTSSKKTTKTSKAAKDNKTKSTKTSKKKKEDLKDGGVVFYESDEDEVKILDEFDMDEEENEGDRQFLDDNDDDLSSTDDEDLDERDEDDDEEDDGSYDLTKIKRSKVFDSDDDDDYVPVGGQYAAIEEERMNNSSAKKKRDKKMRNKNLWYSEIDEIDDTTEEQPKAGSNLERSDLYPAEKRPLDEIDEDNQL